MFLWYCSKFEWWLGTRLYILTVPKFTCINSSWNYFPQSISSYIVPGLTDGGEDFILTMPEFTCSCLFKLELFSIKLSEQLLAWHSPHMLELTSALCSHPRRRFIIIYREFSKLLSKQRVLMHGHQGWNVRHGLCHIYMIYVYIWVVYSFCLFCCLFIIVTTQFVALYKPCKPKPKPSTYDPPDNHPLAEIQRPILRPEPKQQICHQHANTDHFGK